MAVASPNSYAPETLNTLAPTKEVTAQSNSQYSAYSNEPVVFEKRPVSPPRTQSIPPPPKSSISPALVPPPRRPVSSAAEREHSTFSPPDSLTSNQYLKTDNSYSYNEPTVSRNDFQQEPTYSVPPSEYDHVPATAHSSYDNQDYDQGNQGSWQESGADLHEAGQKINRELHLSLLVSAITNIPLLAYRRINLGRTN